LRADDGADAGESSGAGAGAATAALGVKWAHCVNTRLVLEGATVTDVATTDGDKDLPVFHGATNDLMNDGGGSGGTRRALGEKRRVVKVVKSPRCALCGFEYQVWEGGVRVLGDRKVKVHPSGSAADGAIRGIFSGAAL
jgi:RAD51-like protein 1